VRSAVLAPDIATNGGHPPAGVVAWVQAYMAAGGKQDVAAVNLYTDSEQLDPGWNLLAGHIAFLIVLAVRPQGLFPKVN